MIPSTGDISMKLSESSSKEDEKRKTHNHSSTGDSILSFLTLGDGDFTYSLDLVRYLQVAAAAPGRSSQQETDSSATTTKKKIRVIATGIDSHSELLDKYRDAPFILGQLKAKDNVIITNKPLSSHPTTSTATTLEIQIHHGINAIASVAMKNTKNEEDTESTDDSPTTSDDSTEIPQVVTPSDHVIFNHPHLGTEDAVLHSQFLCHLLHSANNYWMKPRGIFHLTLVQGQYERWNCYDAAQRNGLVVLEKNRFRPPSPPPPPTAACGTEAGSSNRETPSSNSQQQQESHRRRNYYQYRRHQTGKSFESRRALGGSQTFTFGRAKEQGLYVATCLPWQHAMVASPLPSVGESGNNEQRPEQQFVAEEEEGAFPCSFCDKRFHEERSRKCHVRDKHPSEAPSRNNGRNKKKRNRQGEQKVPDDEDKKEGNKEELRKDVVFQCQLCSTTSNGQLEGQEEAPRTFGSAQALQDHVRAKHEGQHQQILPDWHHTNNQTRKNSHAATRTTSPESSSDYFAKKQETQKALVVGNVQPAGGDDGSDCVGSCSICGVRYHSQTDQTGHNQRFIPSISSTSSRDANFRCSFCSKSFRENRAKLQHENFCSLHSFTNKT